MNIYLKKGIVFIVLFTFVVTACRKDFEKISVSRWNPEITLPFVKTELHLNDLMPQDSNIGTLPDSLYYFAYHQDSVFAINADSLLNMFDNNFDTSYNFSLGELSMDTFKIASTYSMNDALPYLDQAVRDSLTAHDQTVNIFPPFGFSTPISIELQPVDLYRNLTFSGGFLVISVTNGLPVEVNDIIFTLKDIGNNISLKTVNVESLAGGQVFSDTLFLKGLSLSNEFAFEVTGFGSDGSFPDSVFIDLSQGLDFSFTAKELKVIGGTAKLPQQIMYSERLTIDFMAVNGEKLYNVIFVSGGLNYNFNSELPVRIYVEMKLPSALQNGVMPTADVVIPAMDTYNDSWNLKDMVLDLSSDSMQPFNRFPVDINIVVMPTGEMIEFDSANKVNTGFSSYNVKPFYAEGFFGKREVTIDPDTIKMNMDFLQNLQGEIYLDNPVMKIHYHNGFGIPIKIKADFTAYNTLLNKTVPLNIDSITFDYPENPGDVSSATVQIDKNNSQIVNFMAIRPDMVSVSGGGLSNYNGEKLNFVYDTSTMVANFDMFIPMMFKAGKLNLSDTVKLDVNENDIPANNAAFKIIVENGFPFETQIFLQLADSVSGVVFNSVDLGSVASATVNENTGRVSMPVTDSLLVNLDKTFIDDLQRANSAVFIAGLSTAPGTDAAVGLYSDYKIKIAVGFTAAINP